MPVGMPVMPAVEAGPDHGPERLAWLAERVRAADAAAEEELLQHFKRRVRIMLLARLRDRDAVEDLSQEVLIGTLTAVRKGQVREPRKLAAFVHGIARNVVSNYFRTKGQEPAKAEVDAEMLVVDRAEQLEEAERLESVRRAIEILEPLDREILLMTLVEGFKPGEIAQRKGLNPELVRTRKSRALKKITERVREMSRNAPPAPL
jgi:RNA polymerase sigma-70 factor (ECF subfamily)